MIFFDFLAEPQKFVGSQIEITGILVLVGLEHYLVESVEKRDDRTVAIRIDIPDIKKILFGKVPPSGGTKYLYLDKTTVVGLIQENDSTEFPYRLTNVIAMNVEKSGYEFVVIP